jgi:hypothetical protein
LLAPKACLGSARRAPSRPLRRPHAPAPGCGTPTQRCCVLLRAFFARRLLTRPAMRLLCRRSSARCAPRTAPAPLSCPPATPCAWRATSARAAVLRSPWSFASSLRAASASPHISTRLRPSRLPGARRWRSASTPASFASALLAVASTDSALPMTRAACCSAATQPRRRAGMPPFRRPCSPQRRRAMRLSLYEALRCGTPFLLCLCSR